VACRIRALAKGPWKATERVTVDAIGADLGHQFGGELPVAGSSGTGAVVPHHHGKEYANAAAMKVLHHHAQGGYSARQTTEQIVCAAVVDADVGVTVPQQDAVDAPHALIQIVEVTVYRVLTGGGIEEVSLLHHHLGLHVTGLRPQ
jgi:hypothetical protein